jgi:hypothetical protein
MVFVDKATEAIPAHDRPSGSGDADWWSALGYSEIEASVGTLLVVMVDVGLQHWLEVALADGEDPIETLGTNGPDETLGIRVCPRSSPWGPDDLDTLRFEHFVEWLPEAMVSVVDQETQRCRSGLSRLGQVAGDLGAPLHVGRTVGDPTYQDPSGVEIDGRIIGARTTLRILVTDRS